MEILIVKEFFSFFAILAFACCYCSNCVFLTAWLARQS